MAYIKGKWRWKEDFSLDDLLQVADEIPRSAYFESNGQRFGQITLYTSAVNSCPTGIRYDDQEVRELHAHTNDPNNYYTEYEFHEEYRFMDFGEVEQKIDDWLYNFIVKNADGNVVTFADKLEIIAENEQRVYEAGKAAGHGEGYNEGYTEGLNDSEAYQKGRSDEYDAFWDVFQQKGERKNYSHAFRYNGWSDVNFKPKYGIKPTNADNMFTQSAISDFTKALGELEFDVSNASAVSFILSEIKYASRIPMVLDCRKAPGSQGLFYYSSGIETIDKIIVNENNTFSAWFSDCKNLKNITFEGVIGNNLNISAATLLTKKSITNIIEHLSYNASGKTLTLSQTAVDREFKGVSGADFTTIVEGSVSAEWIGWIASKSNWNISLV